MKTLKTRFEPSNVIHNKKFFLVISIIHFSIGFGVYTSYVYFNAGGF